MLRFAQVPDEIVDRVPEDVRDRVGEIAETVEADPVLAAILIGVGVVTALIFFWGVVKQAFKAAIVGAILSAGAWYWYFNIR
jgi:hypothetical protein